MKHVTTVAASLIELTFFLGGGGGGGGGGGTRFGGLAILILAMPWAPLILQEDSNLVCNLN